MTNEKVNSYKGFGPDWKCRDMQYKVGETFTHDGPVSACNGGLHACEYPLDVLRYYPPNTSKFAEVEQSGTISRHNDDTKVASSVLHVRAELSLAGIIKAAVDYTFRKANPVDPKSPASATGESGAASATGEHSTAMACGENGRVRGIKGAALFLVYRDPSTGAIKKVWAGIAGSSGIKVDTWYTLNARGRPVKVKEA